MKYSFNWIAELASGLGVDARALGALITLKTAELEGVETVAGPGGEQDWILEIDNKSITHRPDLWGHLGMAREAAALTGARLRDPVEMSRLPGGAAAIGVEIADYDLCARYSGLVFEGVRVGPSPAWMQHRLEAIGLNPINNVVDVTNYVMAELAQPMHAFDRDTLSGGVIYVRRARAGESLVALNGQACTLDEQTLVIADGQGAVAIAGIIGGLDTGVTDKTTRIVLESANFRASSIRKSSARLKLRTDASMRFEKSQDPHNTVRGLARAVVLLEQVSPGIRLVGGVADNARLPAAPTPIELDLEWVQRKIGRTVEPAGIRRILEALEFGVRDAGAGKLSVTAPTWRATRDISIKDDVLEEVGRMVGYTTIPGHAPAVPASPPPPNEERDYFHELRASAAAQAFHEVHNYSFISEELAAELGLPVEEHVRVANPIASDQNLLRTTLAGGIVRNVRDNSRHFEHCKFFEIGVEIRRAATAADLPLETPHLAACVWRRDGDGVGELQEAKRLAECLLPGVEVRPAAPRSFEHPVRAWEILSEGQVVGRLGEIHPRLVPGRAAVLDLDLDAAHKAARARAVRYQPLLRYPESAFDLSILVGAREQVGDIGKRLEAAGGDHLRGLEYLRQYSGPPLPESKKSVSYRITVGAADRTLSSDEINAVRTRLIEAMQSAGYELRI